MTAIHIQNLNKTYGSAFRSKQHHALRGVTLSIPAGTLFGLMGPNGAGKTTLIKALLSIVRFDSGSIEILGGSPDSPSVRQKIGYMPERLHFPRVSTPLSFLIELGHLRQIPDPKGEAFRQLGRVGLASNSDRRVNDFSKGMKQRLGLAAALMGDPKLLILDEPTDGIDPVGRKEIRKVIQEEHQRGATILLNSHLLSEVERICQRVGILHQGTLIREGSIDSLCRNSSLWFCKFGGDFSPTDIEALGFQRDPDREGWLFHAEELSPLNEGIEKARSHGALLEELTPNIQTLENLLAEEVERRGS